MQGTRKIVNAQNLALQLEDNRYENLALQLEDNRYENLALQLEDSRYENLALQHTGRTYLCNIALRLERKKTEPTFY